MLLWCTGADRQVTGHEVHLATGQYRGPTHSHSTQAEQSEVNKIYKSFCFYSMICVNLIFYDTRTHCDYNL